MFTFQTDDVNFKNRPLIESGLSVNCDIFTLFSVRWTLFHATIMCVWTVHQEKDPQLWLHHILSFATALLIRIFTIQAPKNWGITLTAMCFLKSIAVGAKSWSFLLLIFTSLFLAFYGVPLLSSNERLLDSTWFFRDSPFWFGHYCFGHRHSCK